MDIMRVISASDLEVRKKTLNLVLDLVSSRNIEEVQSWLAAVSWHSPGLQLSASTRISSLTLLMLLFDLM